MLALLLCPAFSALACEPVASVPATLSEGSFCLAGDIAVSGEAGIHLAGNATLDCRGHRIRDPGHSAVTGVSGEGDNIAIRNCVFEGIYHPVELRGATGFRVERNVFLSPMDIAIYVEGSDGVIADNLIRYPEKRIRGYPNSWYNEAIGIDVWGSAVDIRRNTISAAIPSDGAGWDQRLGIISVLNKGGVIASNIIRGVVPGPDEGRIGILTSGPTVLYRNVLDATAPPSSDTFDYGIMCDDASLAIGNLIVGHAAAYDEHCNH